MKKTLQKAVRTEYAMLRTPLTFLDERVLTRLGEHSKLRSAVGRGLATLDAAAARVLHDESVVRHAAASSTEAATAPEPVTPDEVHERAEVLLAEEEQHPLAGELAEDETLRRVQAELKAKHQLEEEHQTES